MDDEKRRIKLKQGQQKKIIAEAAKGVGSLKKLGANMNIPYSTMKKYNQELFLLPERLFNKILELTQLEKEDLDITYLQSNWGAKIGGKKGMATLQKRYPDKIIEWRKKGIKNSPIPINNPKEIKIPSLDEKLAEFIGVYLGDGTLTKYFVRISGDYRYDKPYFLYLKNLINALFRISAKITKDKKYNTMYLTAFSKRLCSFLKNDYNLNYGHKIRNKTAIPKPIRANKKLSIACLRGLIDTDGSISRRGRNGSQFCIQFTSHNKKLLQQVNEIGKNLQIFTFGDKTGTGTNKQENILRYFNLVGSSNLRHIVRFNERFYNKNTIYQREVIKYYQENLYKNLPLPFKIKVS
ncbi:MAG: hypothetical protein KKF67_01950 [Nanoarchaeota archaeon]|nr:hypothetical protein [Nanoarchaeota archaeon]